MRLSSSLLALLLVAPTHARAEDESPPTDAPSEPEPKPEPEPEPEPATDKKGPTLIGDLNSGWFHLGGGGLAQAGFTTTEGLTSAVSPAGRFTMGGGGYTFFLYGGGGMDLTFSTLAPLQLTGVGYVGVAIPLPVLHPLIGVRGGGGFHVERGASPTPHYTFGPQFGFILRQFDGKPGVRFMVDVSVTPRPSVGESWGEIGGTLSAVF